MAPPLQPSPSPHLTQRQPAHEPCEQRPRAAHLDVFNDGRPFDRRWIDASAARAASTVGEVDPGGEALALEGGVDQPGVDAIEHELGAPEHLERPVGTDVSPRQVHEAVASLALYRGPAEVERIVAPDDLDVDVPGCVGPIAR